MREVTLAVLGANRAGKSTFVQCALDLKRPSTSASATKKVSLEGVVSVLRLLEMQIGDININLEHDLVWPATVGGQSTPPVDGALVLYDVMNQSSLNLIPDVLSECARFVRSLKQRAKWMDWRLTQKMAISTVYGVQTGNGPLTICFDTRRFRQGICADRTCVLEVRQSKRFMEG